MMGDVTFSSHATSTLLRIGLHHLGAIEL
jgi:hypothetical protein